MLRYLYGDELRNYPKLHATMHRDRAAQFGQRLAWDVNIQNGLESDRYDAMNPLYVIWVQPDGCHGGSMRFLPTTAETMINDHFTHLTGGVEIRHPLIWECTRFCLASGAGAKTSARLMLGGLEVGLQFHLTDAVGVFDHRMTRIYRQIGWPPSILGVSTDNPADTTVGIWAFDPGIRPRLLRRAGISDELSQAWLDRAFGSMHFTPQRAA